MATTRLTAKHQLEAMRIMVFGREILHTDEMGKALYKISDRPFDQANARLQFCKAVLSDLEALELAGYSDGVLELELGCQIAWYREKTWKMPAQIHAVSKVDEEQAALMREQLQELKTIIHKMDHIFSVFDAQEMRDYLASQPFVPSEIKREHYLFPTILVR